MAKDPSEFHRFNKLIIFKENDEIDLKALFKIFFQEKILVLAITFIAATISVIYALSLPSLYKADTILAPNTVSQPLAQLKSLSSLVGVKNVNEIDETARALEIIISRHFLSNFVKNHDIAPELFAMTAWDEKNEAPVFDLDVYNAEKKEWLREKQGLGEKAPNDFEIHERFLEILSVEQDQDTSFITVSIETVSPVYSHQWLIWLIQDINKTIRDKKVKEIQKSIAYLEGKAQKTRLSEIRSIFYNLIQEKVQTALLAETRDEYILQTIDPALVPQKKSGPSRAIICVLGTFIGGMFGLMFGLIRYYRK